MTVTILCSANKKNSGAYALMTKSLSWLTVAILFVLQSAATAQQTDIRESIRVEIEQLRESGVLSIGGVDIAAGNLLAEVYERRNFAPNWTDRDEILELIKAIKNLSMSIVSLAPGI